MGVCMPFPMIHLHIAKKLLENSEGLLNPSEFLLGAISPDSVHFRANYSPDFKKSSHLCVGDEKWGWVTNNGEWEANVLHFLERHKGSEHESFAYGYCAHILSDIAHNKRFWIPFRTAHKDELRTKGSTLHLEENEIDFLLFLENHHEIWELLKSARGVDLDGVAASAEIERLKENILYKQYSNRTACTPLPYEAITLQETKRFIEEESIRIPKLMFSV